MSLSDSALDSPEALRIAPFLDPEHWNGHSIGIGDVNSKAQRDPGFIAVGSGLIGLSFVMDNPAEPARDRQYSPGEVFNIGEQLSGKVVAYAKEVLYGATPVDEGELEEIAGLAARPTDTRLGIDVSADPRRKPPLSEAFDRYIEAGDRVYTASTYFGVVSLNGFGRKRFVGFSRGIFYQHDKSGKLTYTRLVVEPEPSEIRIGEVRHSRSGGIERIERINALEIYRQGLPGRSRMKKPSPALARGALKPSVNMA